ncbi:insulin-like growth factor-binding protein complex acid labile subunit [Sitodiplosis mosellana]|uniref:insulin-like growth factor-binding protein complex acid labile subunit n=1 Tax=Sitodiplosis mosellana TaxID=263140 RepID=UPI0024442609|nr:insulin-like growth factor-binding protein complex acid labile subunit [Sitodiplosis mosellana]
MQRYLDEFSNLYSLDISSSGLHLFELEHLKHDQLVKLNASHNEISEFNGDWFANWANLTCIDLSYNKIDHVEGTLNNTKKLNTLWLYGNDLGKETNSFAQLIKMGVSAFISWKSITSIDWNLLEVNNASVMVNSGKEGFFHASDAKLEIHCNENSFEKMELLVLGNNFENPPEMLRCLSSSLKRLFLFGCNDEKLLQCLQLQKFTNLLTFFQLNTTISQFDLNVIKESRELTHLWIHNNKHLRRINNAQVLGNFQDLYVAGLSKNQLENTPEIIQYLSPSVFLLYVDENYVGKVNKTTFQELTKLQKLSLANTNLSFDAPGISEVFESTIRTLDLSGNFVGELKIHAFKGATRLERFYLKSTHLSHVDFGTFINNPQLNMLDLSNNTLKSVLFYIFALSKLGVLCLDGNDITEMEGFTKSNLPNLVQLDISNNQLSCEYFTAFIPEVKRDWPKLVLMGDPWKQKHGQNCNSTN